MCRPGVDVTLIKYLDAAVDRELGWTCPDREVTSATLDSAGRGGSSRCGRRDGVTFRLADSQFSCAGQTTRECSGRGAEPAAGRSLRVRMNR
jgi:hypothetical protein